MDIIEKNSLTEKGWSRHPWELARLKVVLDQFNRHLPEPEVILDLGCGDLFVAEQMSERFPGAKIIAVDTAFEREYISEQNKVADITRITLYQNLGEVPVDVHVSVVLLMDVIEHIEDDITFLTELQGHPSVHGDTHILITVPAFESLWTEHDVILGHYRRYTNKTLKTAIRSAGFKEDRLGYFFFSLIFARLLEVLSEQILRRKRSKTSVTSWSGSDLSSKFIAGVIYSDYKVCDLAKAIGIPLPGLSNYTICRKHA